MAGAESESKPLGAFSAIVDRDALEAFLDVQTPLVGEARWHLEEEGIRCKAVEPANVGMFDATMHADAFESYEAGGFMIGLNLERLSDYVTSKAAKNGPGLIHLSLDPETRKLVVDVGVTEYTMALIDPESIRKEPDMPDLDLPATIGIDGATLLNAIDAAGLVSDHLSFGVDPDEHSFIVAAHGDTDDATTELGDDQLLDANTGSQPAESLFSLDLLEEIVAPIPNDDGAAVRIRLGNEFPIQIDYKLADEHVTVSSALAPRIQSE